MMGETLRRFLKIHHAYKAQSLSYVPTRGWEGVGHASEQNPRSQPHGETNTIPCKCPLQQQDMTNINLYKKMAPPGI